MKVSELIKILSTYDENSEVDLTGEPDDYGYWSACLWVDENCIFEKDNAAGEENDELL